MSRVGSPRSVRAGRTGIVVVCRRRASTRAFSRTNSCLFLERKISHIMAEQMNENDGINIRNGLNNSSELI